MGKTIFFLEALEAWYRYSLIPIAGFRVGGTSVGNLNHNNIMT